MGERRGGTGSDQTERERETERDAKREAAAFFKRPAV